MANYKLTIGGVGFKEIILTTLVLEKYDYEIRYFFISVGMFANGMPSDTFISRLAQDSTLAKSGLREMFRRVDDWNEDLQAVILNNAEKFKEYADALKSFIGNKFRPDKKKTKLFQELAKAVGVYDGKAGSEYQKLFAKLADELNGRKLDFKLFLSINPAHILTASNPIDDQRGQCLVRIVSTVRRVQDLLSVLLRCVSIAAMKFTTIDGFAIVPTVSTVCNNCLESGYVQCEVCDDWIPEHEEHIA